VGADEAPLLALEPDGWAELEEPAAGLPFFFAPAEAVLSLLEPALAPVDSREALPAEAPETSELELFALLGAEPDELLGEFAELPLDGELWAKALVAAPAAARAATAQSVVKVRIWDSSVRAPSGLYNWRGSIRFAQMGN
jgi:hypothetical protein